MPLSYTISIEFRRRAKCLGICLLAVIALDACARPMKQTGDFVLEAPYGRATATIEIADRPQGGNAKSGLPRGLRRAAPALRGLAAGDDGEPWLTRGEKTRLLNAGAATALTAWGIYKWDYGQQSPKAAPERWFGQSTEEGGADKLGHIWSAYALSHLFASIYEAWDYTPDEATAYGTLSSLGFHALMEFGDSFSDFGFSYEDMVMNLAGAGAGYLLREYPRVGEKIDIRIEYAPSLVNNNDVDVFTDYEHQKFVVAVKGEGFESMRGSLFEYLEFQTGYFARGYEGFIQGGPETRRRTFYVGLGLNVGKVVSHVWDTALFDYFQVPGTYIPFDAKLDQ